MGIAPIASLRKISIAAALAASALLVDGVTETATLHAQTAGTCSVTGNTLDFGQATFEQLIGGLGRTQTTINVSCPGGTSFQVGIDNGSNALTGQRRMRSQSTTDFVGYELYKSRIGSQRFGDAIPSERVSDTARGIRPESIAVFGELVAGQNAPAGRYIDNAVITVYF